MAFWPPVSAMSATGLPSGRTRWASVELMRRATSVDPVNKTPQVRGSTTSATLLACSGQQLQHTGRDPRLAQNPHGLCRNERRLFGRLGKHTIARGECRGHLPAQMARGKFHGLMHTRPQRPVRLVGKRGTKLRCVVAQKINSLAHLAHRIGHGFPEARRTTRPMSRGISRPSYVGGTLETGRAGATPPGSRLPERSGGHGTFHRGAHLLLGQQPSRSPRDPGDPRDFGFQAPGRRRTLGSPAEARQPIAGRRSQ